VEHFPFFSLSLQSPSVTVLSSHYGTENYYWAIWYLYLSTIALVRYVSFHMLFKEAVLSDFSVESSNS